MRLLNTVLLLTGFVLGSSAWAHASLSSSTPANGAVLNASPSTLELTFSAPVRLVRVTLQDHTKKDIALTVPSGIKSEAQYSIPLPELTFSHYTVSWVVMGEDGHKMSGLFKFMLHNNTAMKAQ